MSEEDLIMPDLVAKDSKGNLIELMDFVKVVNDGSIYSTVNDPSIYPEGEHPAEFPEENPEWMWNAGSTFAGKSDEGWSKKGFSCEKGQEGRIVHMWCKHPNGSDHNDKLVRLYRSWNSVDVVLVEIENRNDYFPGLVYVPIGSTGVELLNKGKMVKSAQKRA